MSLTLLSVFRLNEFYDLKAHLDQSVLFFSDERRLLLLNSLRRWKNWTFYRDNKMSIICKFIDFL